MAFSPVLHKKQFLFYGHSILKMSGNWEKYKNIFICYSSKMSKSSILCVCVKFKWHKLCQVDSPGEWDTSTVHITMVQRVRVSPASSEKIIAPQIDRALAWTKILFLLPLNFSPLLLRMTGNIFIWESKGTSTIVPSSHGFIFQIPPSLKDKLQLSSLDFW